LFYDTEGEAIEEFSSRFLCVAGVFGIDVFAINGTSGALTLVPGSPFVDNSGPFGVVAAPSTKFIYVRFRFYRRDCSTSVIQSGRFRTSRGLGPSAAPTIPSFSMRSMRCAARP
jgi:hypothetical protein